MSQLWKSALNGGMSDACVALNKSLKKDIRLLPYDIKGSMAHAAMLAKQNLISETTAQKIQAGLEDILAEADIEKLALVSPDEDVHSLVERLLVEKIGPQGSQIHIGRSRNEQVLLDTTLYLIDAVTQQQSALVTCIEKLAKLQSAAGTAMMPSYTHLQRAQPIFVKQMWHAHQTLWSMTLNECSELLLKLKTHCPMGAGAINGTTLPTHPQTEATYLGFSETQQNPLATISNRHLLLNYGAVCSHWFLNVSRLMEDLIVWSSTEFHFVKLKPSVTTGSSMMPNKRNPDICELIRGKASVVMGQYVGLMSLFKGLPMGYMKDMQEDKTFLFTIIDEMNAVLNALPELLESVDLNFEAMAVAVRDPLLLSTDVMEWLVSEKQIPLREAHHMIANAVATAAKENLSFLSVLKIKWPDLPTGLLAPEVSCQKRFKGNF